MLGIGVSAQGAPVYGAQLLQVDFGTGAEPGLFNPMTSARGINNAGQIVGSSSGTSATLWGQGGAAPGRRLEMPPDDAGIGGNFEIANAINATGVVAGSLGGRLGGGVAWRDGASTWIPNFREATGINDAGVIVGTGFFEYSALPAQWEDGVYSVLPTLPDSVWGGAVAINNPGVIAGWRLVLPSEPEPPAGALLGPVVTLWEGSVPRSLDILGAPADINDRGQVVGSLYNDPVSQGFLWSPDGVSYLAPLTGEADVRALNESGLVVGRSALGGRLSALDTGLATLWEDGQPLDLNNLLAPNQLESDWVLRQAYDINDLGWIVGDAVNARTGDVRGYVLTPLDVQVVPEPPALVLVLGGLLALGVVLRHRRRA